MNKIWIMIIFWCFFCSVALGSSCDSGMMKEELFSDSENTPGDRTSNMYRVFGRRYEETPFSSRQECEYREIIKYYYASYEKGESPIFSSMLRFPKGKRYEIISDGEGWLLIRSHDNQSVIAKWREGPLIYRYPESMVRDIYPRDLSGNSIMVNISPVPSISELGMNGMFCRQYKWKKYDTSLNRWHPYDELIFYKTISIDIAQGHGREELCAPVLVFPELPGATYRWRVEDDVWLVVESDSDKPQEILRMSLEPFRLPIYAEYDKKLSVRE